MFRFKQFTVHQENSAMKVCTDSCLLGALAGADQPVNALDIGAGTGLLSLMLAQRYPTLTVDAVEINPGAATDTRHNFAQSPFADRLQLYECAIQNFETSKTYDLIVSNPPFYENRLKSPDPHKNMAHHATGLSFKELAALSARLLSPSGILWILLPPFEMSRFIHEATINALSIKERHIIRHHTGKPAFREVVSFSRCPAEISSAREIIIYENDKYSRIFAELLRDYYLIF